MRRLINFKKLTVKLFGAFALCAIVCAAVFGLLVNKKSSSLNNAKAYTNADVSSIVVKLSADESALETNYSLLDYYPVMPENQTTSELCWIYSSMKVLETSIMVQANEYYNFSEVATAYVAYKMGVRAAINSTGRYQDFVDTALAYGLVHEAEFSNGNYFDIDEDNEEHYGYVLDYLDKSISNNVKPVNIYSNDDYRNLNYNDRIEFIKRYIKEYGGLFGGLEAGVIYSSGVNIYENNPNKPGDEDYLYIKSHAVCLVGWDDNYGFLALNSWGVEEPRSYQTFYIPFNYIEMHNTINGFVYESNAQKVEVESSSAATFAPTVLKSDKVLNNVFSYGEELKLSYVLSNSINFENVYVNIFKGEELVTNNFALTYDDSLRKIQLTLKPTYSGFVGGTYIVKFYEDKTFISSKNFYVFTGTEISYFKLQKNDRLSTTDSTILMNSFVNSINQETYYISSLDSYKLYFYLTPLNKWANTRQSLDFTVSELYKYTYTGGKYQKEETDISFTYENGTLKDWSNCYVVNIPALLEHTNCKLEFTITITSTVYPLLSREYVITLFASSSASSATTDAKIVHYDLDGGLNSPYNVKRLPLSSRDSSVQKFELFAPTKIGYEFIGWYTNPEFSGSEVLSLDGSANQDVYLYANWKQDTTNYFETSLFIDSVVGYDGTEKTPSNRLVYGDKIVLDYTFTVLDELNKYNFSSVYYLNVNNRQVARADLGKTTKSMTFEFDLNTLKAGEYVVSISAVVVVSHSLSISRTRAVNLTVSPRNISFEFAELEFVYDGTSHKPNVSVEENAFYEEDLQGRNPIEMFEVSNVSAINVGEYVFEILGINNENYVIEGTSSCTVEILPREITIEWVDLSKIYNGEVQLPEFEIVGKVAGEEISAKLNTNSFKNVGDYVVGPNLIKIENKNYTLKTEDSEVFKIVPAQLVVKINDVKERIQISPSYRKQPTYAIEGMLYDTESKLNILIQSEGLSVEKSGVYDITGTYNNSNYDITFETAKYTLSGDYTVTYKLPNGEEYIEYVKEGEDPKGIDKSVYKKPFFGKIEYSEPLINSYEDMYIDVIETDYTWIVAAVAIVLVFVIIYLAMTHKTRRNKVS